MGRILCTFPGRAGDLLWALPTVRAISEAYGQPVDLLIAGEFAGLTELLARQPYLDRVYADPAWSLDRDGRQPPGRGDLISPYDRVIHLGYRRWPEQPLPREIEAEAVADGWLRPGVVDLGRPWITVTPKPAAYVVTGWTDCWFELKVGLMEIVFEYGDGWTYYPLVPPGSRWVIEADISPCGWVEAAERIAGARIFLGDCSALHVLACALGKPCVLVEPMEARWNPIFYPFGMDGPVVRVVKGVDGRPTFDARHTADVLKEALGGL